MSSLNEVGKESESDKPKKSPCKRRKCVAIILAVLIVGAICCHIHHFHHSRSRSIDPEPGTICTVQFRRDALGGASLTSPLTNKHNGAEVSLGGTLIAINREAILLEYSDPSRYGQPGTRRLWIPKSSILLIEYE